MEQFKTDSLTVKVFPTRDEMGKGAAVDVQGKLIELLKEKQEVNMIFASAPSQNELLKYLAAAKNIAWDRVNAFHMDEYIGLAAGHPQLFSNYLNRTLFTKLPFKSVSLINSANTNYEEICQEYSNLLRKFPVDIVCMGIGENNHIAFNDPHVADFNDPLLVKKIDLDEKSRMQQVHDGCFNDLDEVPKTAITLTIPALTNAKFIFCVVPGTNKAPAVERTLKEDITEKYPSTILRNHPDSILYLDKDSASLL